MTVTAAFPATARAEQSTRPAPLPHLRPVPGVSRSTPRPGTPTRGFVLSVDLSATDEQDPAEVLRVVSTLAELASEWFPQARARAVVSAPGRPPRAVPATAGRLFRDRLDRLEHEADVVVDTTHQSVTVAGRHVDLAAQEIALLVHLANAGSRPVPRSELLDAVWKGHELTAGSRTIDVHVRRLRAKTGLADLVATVWGVGYRLDPTYTVRVQG